MKTLLGQASEYESLLERASVHAIHHGILFEGLAGFGKSHAALELAATLLCDRSEASGRACGACPSCAKVGTGNHPDLHRVTVPEGKKAIPIDAIRDLQSTLALGTVEGRARVAILDPADRLGEQGQNALLKTLEEPGHATFLILAARRPEGLLDTVRSRLMRYRLRGVPTDVLADALDAGAVHPDRRRRAVEAAQGSLGLAREFCGAEAQRADDAISGVLTGHLSPFQAAGLVIEGADGRVDADRLARLALRQCGALCRAELRKANDPSLAPGRQPTYSVETGSWIRASEAVFAAEGDLAVEIGAQQALGELFLRWTEIFAR